MLSGLYAKALLTAIALLLAVLAFRPIFAPAPVRARSDSQRFFVEPGNSLVRKPGGDLQVPGKVIVDLQNGDAWGFPTAPDVPYPVDYINNAPDVSTAIYLGRFDFSSMKHPK